MDALELDNQKTVGRITLQEKNERKQKTKVNSMTDKITYEKIKDANTEISRYNQSCMIVSELERTKEG